MATQKSKPLSPMETASFCSQIALILESGISGIEGITILLEDAETADEKQLLQTMLDAYQLHGSLRTACEAAGVFPEYMLHMTEIGEQTGKLDEVMTALSRHYEREDSISKTIKNAVTYPCLMVGMMMFVILVLIVKVMPIFNQVFEQLGTEMTGFSRGVLNIGTTLSRYSIIFLVLLTVLILLIVYLTQTFSGKKMLMRAGYHFRFARSIYEGTALCRFASGMALTLSSGLHSDQSIELVTGLIDNPYFREKIARCQERMKNGEDFADALVSAHIFTGMNARLASIASRTGALDTAMNKIAENYEDDIDVRINHLLSILEPTLVIALSLIVGAILLSVMLPLMGVMASL